MGLKGHSYAEVCELYFKKNIRLSQFMIQYAQTINEDPNIEFEIEYV